VPSLGVAPGGAELPMEDEERTAPAPQPSVSVPAPVTATPVSFAAPAN
jgi:hypothetical protein